MLIFVYCINDTLKNKVLNIFKELKFNFINSKEKILDIIKKLEPKKHYVTLNFTKNQIQFEYFIQRLKVAKFIFLERILNLPKYVTHLINTNQYFYIKNPTKENIIKCLNRKLKLKISWEYIWFNEISFIDYKHDIYKQNLECKLSLKKHGKYNDKYIYSNKGQLCYLFTLDTQYLYMVHKKNVYKFKNSYSEKMEEGPPLHCLKLFIRATESRIVGAFTIVNNIFTFTFIGVNSKEYNFNDIYQIFLDYFIKLKEQSSNKILLTETKKYYLQKYENFYFYLPKIFTPGEGLNKLLPAHNGLNLDFHNILFIK